jgi:hypothetical protein
MVKAKHKGARLAGFRGASDRENENPGRMYIARAQQQKRAASSESGRTQGSNARRMDLCQACGVEGF